MLKGSHLPVPNNGKVNETSKFRLITSGLVARYHSVIQPFLGTSQCILKISRRSYDIRALHLDHAPATCQPTN